MRLPILSAVAAALLGAASLARADITLQPVGRYQGVATQFASGAAEIVAYDKGTRRIFVVNAQDGTVDVLNATDPSHLVKVAQIDVRQAGRALGAANSVAVRDGLVAVAVEADPVTEPGLIAFYDATSLELLRTVPAGALPDAVAFSNTGHFVIAVNEGEPRGAVDPEGSITIVDLRDRGRNRPAFSSCTADFRAFNAQRAALVAAGVVIDPRSASVAQDLEPEYAVAVGNNAYVTLQENNAIAVVQLEQCRVQRIMPLGFKDHGLPRNALDTSDREINNGNGRIELRAWPNLYGVYQPDSIAAYEAGDGQTYLVFANEGDVRDAQEARVSALTLDADAFANPDTVKANANLGRLTVNRTLGCKLPLDASGNCAAYDRLFAYGARSFSILTTDGRMVFDSANDFERIIADKVKSGMLAPQAFNANHTSNSAGAVPGQTTITFDTRSDDKGPEPEGVVVGRVGDRNYAFVGLERIGGVMIYDVTDPANAFYVDYVNHRNFAVPVCTTVNPATGVCTSGVPNPAALDLGPEGLAFVPAGDSPNGRPLLIVGNEVSGSTTVFEIVPKP